MTTKKQLIRDLLIGIPLVSYLLLKAGWKWVVLYYRSIRFAGTIREYWRKEITGEWRSR